MVTATWRSSILMCRLDPFYSWTATVHIFFIPCPMKLVPGQLASVAWSARAAWTFLRPVIGLCFFLSFSLNVPIPFYFISFHKPSLARCSRPFRLAGRPPLLRWLWSFCPRSPRPSRFPPRVAWLAGWMAALLEREAVV